MSRCATPSTTGTRYEHQLDQQAGSGATRLAPAMAAASRRTRSILAADARHLPAPLVEVAAGVAGPLLTGYVLWCFEQARRAGCRRLYFVARDGEVLLSMARTLAGALGLDLDLRYLAGSRRAWLVAGSTGVVDVEGLDSVAGRGEVTSVRTLLDWTGLPPEEATGELAAAGFPPSSWDAPLDRSRVADLLDVLRDPAVAQRVRTGAGGAASAAVQYLRESGLTDGQPYAIVDMEGRGNVGRLLDPVVRAAGGQPPLAECYFALVSPAPSPGRSLLGYMYDEGRGTGTAERAGDVHVALEVFTAGSHGGVRGYRPARGGVEVVLARERNDPALDWGLDGLRRVLGVFTEQLAGSLQPADLHDDVRDVTWGALRTFWLAPSREEVDVWGSFPFEDGSEHYAIAEGLPTRQVLGRALSGRLQMRRRGTWPAGVRANAPVHLRLAQRVVRWARAALRG